MTPLTGARFDHRVEQTGLLWLAAILFFGVGDLVTTTVGLTAGTATEVGPVVSMVVDRYGLAAVVGVKTGALLLGALLWRLTPDPYDVGVPAGLALVGVVVTGWNTWVLLAGGGI